MQALDLLDERYHLRTLLELQQQLNSIVQPESAPRSEAGSGRLLCMLDLTRLACCSCNLRTCCCGSGENGTRRRARGGLSLCLAAHSSMPRPPFPRRLCAAVSAAGGLSAWPWMVAHSVPAEAAGVAGLSEEPAVLVARACLGRVCANLNCTCMVGASEAAMPKSRCGGCGVATFCGKACQRAAWSASHKLACQRS